jgi:hypothetical protein
MAWCLISLAKEQFTSPYHRKKKCSFHQVALTPFQARYYSENPVSAEIEPRALDL